MPDARVAGAVELCLGLAGDVVDQRLHVAPLVLGRVDLHGAARLAEPARVPGEDVVAGAPEHAHAGGAEEVARGAVLVRVASAAPAGADQDRGSALDPPAAPRPGRTTARCACRRTTSPRRRARTPPAPPRVRRLPRRRLPPTSARASASSPPRGSGRVREGARQALPGSARIRRDLDRSATYPFRPDPEPPFTACAGSDIRPPSSRPYRLVRRSPIPDRRWQILQPD